MTQGGNPESGDATGDVTDVGDVAGTTGESDAGDAGRPGRERDPLVELDELSEGGNRMSRVAVHLGDPGHVAEHEEVRRRPVHEPERHARVRGMDE